MKYDTLYLREFSVFTDLFNNVVTFRIADASINLPTFDMGHSGDIYFEFRTTVENAVIIHSKGPTDYIKISIIGKSKINNLWVWVVLTYMNSNILLAKLFAQAQSPVWNEITLVVFQWKFWNHVSQNWELHCASYKVGISSSAHVSDI